MDESEPPSQHVELSVMSLNAWGMPKTLGSKDKLIRMDAIGQHIQKGEHDVYLLQELWMRPDHAKIKSCIPPGYHMTEYVDLAARGCDGKVGPYGCSGLAVVSRHKFVDVKFHPFSDRGPFRDGEYFAGKGVGHVRIKPGEGFTVDVFVTHTCAGGYNSYYRQKQIKQLVQIVEKSDASFIILGGDFNFDPYVNNYRPQNDSESTLEDIQKVMVNSMEDFLKTKELDPKQATYANPTNTYSSQKSPVLYDYIFHKSNGQNYIKTNSFEVPLLKIAKEGEGELSFSDHEAITTTLSLHKKT